nr:BTB/POZ domain-containing protein 18 [Pelodiscus sinensis]|eukprot:XP_014426654.1 BTB/POZ domain-containing protein 18 [Pelodiscus sinensis]
MCSPVAGSKILYRNSRLLRMAFLQLHRQQRADVFCDVILQAEGEAVPAHCCILSACSPFFMERLERQTPSKGCKVVLELRGLKIGTLRKLVDFLYTSEMEVSREEALDVLAAARQFQVAELESLQLEGGKLVKQVLGRRLNRKCLQSPSPAPISARVMPQACSPAPSAPQTFLPLVAGKQHTGGGTSAGQAESTKRKGAAVAQNGEAQLQDADAPALPVETGNVRPKSHPLAFVRSLGVGSTLGEAEGAQGERRAEQALPSEGATTDCSPLPRKIKLSRLKLPPPSKTCAPTAPLPAAPGNPPTSIRRLWRQKAPGGDEAGGAEQASPSCCAGSPPVPPKSSHRKRSSSASASGSDTAPEEGHVGRVKLRKVVNGSCWEVVQDPPAREPQAASVTTGETGTCCAASPHNFTGMQAAGSAERPAGRLEPSLLPELATVEQGPSEGRGGCRDPYELDVAALEPLSESEEFGDSAPLEQMLDLLLADSSMEGLGAAGPAGAPSTGPGEKWCPAEAQLWPAWDNTEKGPLPGWEVGGGHSAHGAATSQPEGDEIAVGAGAEEPLVPAGVCVRPDLSSESEEEVDVLN